MKHPYPAQTEQLQPLKGGNTMDESDSIFLALSAATSGNLMTDVGANIDRECFMHWYKIFSELYQNWP